MKILSLFLILCLLLAGCGAPAATDGGFTFTDDLSRTVTVDDPQRVAPLLGSFAQIWMLAGGQVCATADDAWDDLALDLPEDAVNLGGAKSLNLELLLSARPDFILASANTRQHLEWQDALTATGIAVAYFDVADFEDYLRLLNLCTDITGRKDLYEVNGLQVQAQIDHVLTQSAARVARTGAPTVLCLRTAGSGITVKGSEGNVLGAMLQSLGCVNIADSDATLLEQLSMERILQADPDYIFFVQQGDDTAGAMAQMEQLLADPAWAGLTAVREGRVHLMDKALYNLKPNHRWGEAYEGLEAILAHDP